MQFETKNLILDTLDSIWSWFGQEDLTELESFLLCIQDIKDPEERAEEQMDVLRQLAAHLCPSHLPDEEKFFQWLSFLVVSNDQLDRDSRTPVYCCLPSEKRFLRNCRKNRFYFSDYQLKAEQIRRLDAIVGLF